MSKDSHFVAPKLSKNTVLLIVIAGAFATVMFDVWGQVISPLIGMGRLSPEGLSRALLKTLGLPSGASQGHLMHLVIVGLIAYPIGWMYIFAPLWNKVVGPTHWFVPAAIYGVGLFIVAIGGMTTIAGMKPFLGFGKITWTALVGHTIYGIAVVWALKVLNALRPNSAGSSEQTN